MFERFAMDITFAPRGGSGPGDVKDAEMWLPEKNKCSLAAPVIFVKYHFQSGYGTGRSRQPARCPANL